MNHLALIVEFHHPVPGPGALPGDDWVASAVETYWPLLCVLAGLAERPYEAALTVAVSPSWTACAAEPGARDRVRAALERRAAEDDSGRALARFALDRWDGDALGPLRRAQDVGAIELIPTTASHTWLPSVAQEPVLARAQVRLAVADHRRNFGRPPRGIWLPFLAYLPGLESILAEAGLRYFGVHVHPFLRGTARPAEGEFGTIVTPPGVAAFAVNPALTQLLTDRDRCYARDPRYREAAGSEAVAAHAEHFLDGWRGHVARAERSFNPHPISVAALSAIDLGGAWRQGPAWLDRVVRRLAEGGETRPTTLGRYVDQHPEGTMGRPGPSAGGPLAARPGDSAVLDRCRQAADLLADAVARRRALDPLGTRAVAQMTRALLQAQRVDWSLPPGADLHRAGGWLDQFHELAGALASGRIDGARLASLERGTAYLPEVDPALLAPG